MADDSEGGIAIFLEEELAEMTVLGSSDRPKRLLKKPDEVVFGGAGLFLALESGLEASFGSETEAPFPGPLEKMGKFLLERVCSPPGKEAYEASEKVLPPSSTGVDGLGFSSCSAAATDAAMASASAFSCASFSFLRCSSFSC